MWTFLVIFFRFMSLCRNYEDDAEVKRCFCLGGFDVSYKEAFFLRTFFMEILQFAHIIFLQNHFIIESNFDRNFFYE